MRAPLVAGLLLLILLNVPKGMGAQLCNGSLGDPVVNITFGTVSNPGSSAYAPPNTYVYTSSSCPDDGFYTITRSTSACFGNSWHTVNADHTGNGAFMLVNASFAPGDFFLSTVDGLCPNTTYEFAAWLMNVMIPDGIKPDVTFTIEKPDGTILGQFATGNIPQTGGPVWKQYGLFFTTPADHAEVVLRITNNAPGGIGNDIALDDITFRPCGPEITATVQGNNDTLDICEGSVDSYLLDAAIPPTYVSPVFQWQESQDGGNTWIDIPAATGNTYQRDPTGPGTYRYRITVMEASAGGLKVCRIASNDILLNVHAKPLVDAGPDRVLISGQSLTLKGRVEGETPVLTWSPPDHLSDVTEAEPVASPPSDITYTLTAVTSFGCTNEDKVMIKVVAGVFIPTAFTPNNDGLNDTWQIPFLDPEWEPEVSVFNRYGQVIYKYSGTNVAWDGNYQGARQGSGTYVYVVRLRALGLIYKGTLTVIR